MGTFVYGLWNWATNSSPWDTRIVPALRDAGTTSTMALVAGQADYHYGF